jgi:hypothetical protein
MAFLKPKDGSFALGGDGWTRRRKWAGGVAVGCVWMFGTVLWKRGRVEECH